MKNTKKIIAMTLLLSLSAKAVDLSNPQSKSISYANSNIDFGIKTDNFKSESITLDLNQSENNKQAALAALKAVRAEMWDKNVPYTYDTKSNSKNSKLRDVLKEKGINSKEEYLNYTKWSTDLEKIAIQRMYEVGITGMNHTRPDGSDLSTAKLPSGTRTFAEILAYNSAPFTPSKAFSQWVHGKRASFGNKSEYDLLLESDGVYNDGNAHLHIILDPEYNRMGLCINNTTDTNFVGVEFGYADKSGNKATGLVGDYTMDFGKSSSTGNKGIDKKTRENLEKAVNENKTRIAAANLLLEMAPKKVADIKDQLLTLIKESEDLIKLAEKVLQGE